MGTAQAGGRDGKDRLVVEEKFCLAPHFSYPLSQGDVLAASFSTLDPKVLSHRCVGLLQACTQFETLEKHAERLISNLSWLERRQWRKSLRSFCENGDLRQSIQSYLHWCAKEGLLLSNLRLLEQVKVQSEQEHAPSISTWGLFTCRRPMDLKTSLESFLHEFRKFDRKITGYVLDGSFSPEFEEKNRTLLRSFKRSDLIYVGQVQRIKLKNLFSAPPEILEFAFGEDRPYGVLNNIFQILSVGELSIRTDDQTFANPRLAPTSKLSLSFAEDLFKFDLQSCSEPVDGEPFEHDLLSKHEMYLGRSLAGCVWRGHQTGDFHWDSWNFEQVGIWLSHLVNQGRGRVLISLNSWLEAPTPDDFSLMLSLREGLSKENDLSREKYLKILSSKKLLKSSQNIVIQRTKRLTGPIFGMDNRELLPPYFPESQDGDGLFSEMISKCFLQAFQVHWPFWLEYRSSEKPNVSGFEVRPMEVLSYLISRFQPLSLWSTPEENMRVLGSRMLAWSQGSLEELRSEFHSYRLKELSSRIQAYQMLLRKFNNEPKCWSAYVEKSIQACVRAMKSQAGLASTSLLQSRGEEAEKYLVHWIKLYSQLLLIWPDLIAQAKELKQSGKFENL